MKGRFKETSLAMPDRPVPVPRKSARKLKTKAIVLISEDSTLAERLCRAAQPQGLSIVRAGHGDEALEQLKTAQPVAVLLDLDLPENAAWSIADRLLQEETCPQLVLLTGRIGHFDLGAANRAGSVIDKTADLAWLLEVLLREPQGRNSAQAARNEIQRVLIRWLLPCEWPVPIVRAHRWWGINE